MCRVECAVLSVQSVRVCRVECARLCGMCRVLCAPPPNLSVRVCRVETVRLCRDECVGRDECGGAQGGRMRNQIETFWKELHMSRGYAYALPSLPPLCK